MRREILQFFNVQRSIFGICPCCNRFIRLSDCHIFSGRSPGRTWLDRMEAKEDRLNRREEAVEDRLATERERARESARRDARKRIGLIDPVFIPRKLDADDAKVVFHPADFAVFCGLKSKLGGVTRIVLLDRESKDEARRRLQRSMETAVAKRRFDWHTVRVQEDGSVRCE